MKGFALSLQKFRHFQASKVPAISRAKSHFSLPNAPKLAKLYQIICTSRALTCTASGENSNERI